MYRHSTLRVGYTRRQGLFTPVICLWQHYAFRPGIGCCWSNRGVFVGCRHFGSPWFYATFKWFTPFDLTGAYDSIIQGTGYVARSSSARFGGDVRGTMWLGFSTLLLLLASVCSSARVLLVFKLALAFTFAVAFVVRGGVTWPMCSRPPVAAPRATPPAAPPEHYSVSLAAAVEIPPWSQFILRGEVTAPPDMVGLVETVVDSDLGYACPVLYVLSLRLVIFPCVVPMCRTCRCVWSSCRWRALDRMFRQWWARQWVCSRRLPLLSHFLRRTGLISLALRARRRNANLWSVS